MEIRKVSVLWVTKSLMLKEVEVTSWAGEGDVKGVHTIAAVINLFQRPRCKQSTGLGNAPVVEYTLVSDSPRDTL